MLIPDVFLHFIIEKGRKLSEINPGSREMALKPLDAIRALDLLAGSQVAILGGDVLSDRLGKLSYIYENWYCNKLIVEAPLDFVMRSQKAAHEFIDKLIERRDSTLFVVLVYSELGIIN